jgi:hypothetical protein
MNPTSVIKSNALRARNGVLGDRVPYQFIPSTGFPGPSIDMTTVRRSTECSPQFQIAEKWELSFNAENLEWNLSTDKHGAKI